MLLVKMSIKRSKNIFEERLNAQNIGSAFLELYFS